MNPDLNQQPRRGIWPWPVDTPLDRARRIAGLYRARLNLAAPDNCAEADQLMRDYGETWMLDKPDIIDPDTALTTAQAAELVNVPVARIRKWAGLNHPEKPGEPLLPRFKMRGRDRTYLAEHVLAAAAAMRRYRHAHGGS
ncbi:hypothetical protein GCM10010172_06550 [Paractinoplanes ferrugineus]|uniref:Uncharacterized protein n=1 Tax=Paractinoplanes ferrugineus TaxID=113564 RepID=A0A919JAI6_9ACTN|nr:hypothetical protein [Actinoplanes ferrugineus]GIE16317.1 hypothetical protein Afe05nite_81570 [Actinoplanes ferrugineus]